MSTPNQFRLPVNVAGKAEPEVVEAIGWHDDAINDLQQAIPALKSQISALQASTTAGTNTTTNVTSGSTTVINPATLPQGGDTADRPVSPVLYQTYYDTTLGYPVYWNGTAWVNSAGVPV